MILKGNEDLRVRRTIRSIKDSFLALLNEQAYESITVTGLALRAGISKKTFYYYYSSLDALLEEMEEELIDIFLDEIRDIDIIDFDKIVKQFLLFFENKEGFLFKMVLDHEGRVFGDGITEKAREKGVKAFGQVRVEDEYRKKVVRYYTDTAMVASYRMWLSDGKKVSADKTAATVKEIVLNGLLPLLDKTTGRSI